MSVGPLRAKIIAACAPYTQDAVITGLNSNEVGALLFPTMAVRKLVPHLPADAPLKEALESPAVQQHFQGVVDALAKQATGSSSRVARLHLMHEAPSIEFTGKWDQRRGTEPLADQLVHALNAQTPFTVRAQLAEANDALKHQCRVFERQRRAIVLNHQLAQLLGL